MGRRRLCPLTIRNQDKGGGLHFPASRRCADTHRVKLPFYQFPHLQRLLWVSVINWEAGPPPQREGVRPSGSVPQCRGHASAKGDSHSPGPADCFRARMRDLMSPDFLIFLEKLEIQTTFMQLKKFLDGQINLVCGFHMTCRPPACELCFSRLFTFWYLLW